MRLKKKKGNAYHSAHSGGLEDIKFTQIVVHVQQILEAYHEGVELFGCGPKT